MYDIIYRYGKSFSNRVIYHSTHCREVLILNLGMLFNSRIFGDEGKLIVGYHIDDYAYNEFLHTVDYTKLAKVIKLLYSLDVKFITEVSGIDEDFHKSVTYSGIIMEIKTTQENNLTREMLSSLLLLLREPETFRVLNEVNIDQFDVDNTLVDLLCSIKYHEDSIIRQIQASIVYIKLIDKKKTDRLVPGFYNGCYQYIRYLVNNDVYFRRNARDYITLVINKVYQRTSVKLTDRVTIAF